MSDIAVTRGAHHIGLTVPDLARTRAFFLDTLGFAQVGEVPNYPAVFLTDGTTMITLWQAENPETAVSSAQAGGTVKSPVATPRKTRLAGRHRGNPC